MHCMSSLEQQVLMDLLWLKKPLEKRFNVRAVVGSEENENKMFPKGVEAVGADMLNVEEVSSACNLVSRIAFEGKLNNKVILQKIVYRDIREWLGLAAQLAIRVIAKVVETYKAN